MGPSILLFHSHIGVQELRILSVASSIVEMNRPSQNRFFRFLSDPGIPGVRSMGPSLSNSVKDLFENTSKTSNTSNTSNTSKTSNTSNTSNSRNTSKTSNTSNT